MPLKIQRNKYCICLVEIISDHVIVHEWGHLRWGLRDEYPTLKNPGGNGGGDAINPGDGGDGLSTGSGDNTQKFYQAGGVWKPVR